MNNMPPKNELSPEAAPSSDKIKIKLPLLWPYRLLGNILILVLLVFFAAGILVIKSDMVSRQLNSLSDYFYGLTSYLGFTIDDIIVYGRNKTAVEEIYNIVNARRGDNILSLNIRQIKDIKPPVFPIIRCDGIWPVSVKMIDKLSVFPALILYDLIFYILFDNLPL